MTIASTTRKAGPLLGNGVQSTWPFAFKVFAATDIKVTIANAAGVETVLTSNYSVALNANQETSPGGTVTYPVSGAKLPTGSVLSITGNLPYDQPLDLPGGGNFSPLAVENQFDRSTMQIQQLREEMDRTAKLPPTSSESVEELVDDLQRIADSADNLDTVAGSIVSVNTVATNVADVNTVASVAGAVAATGANIAAVAAVGADLLEPTSEINTVAVSIANVNAVGNAIADVGAVAGIAANVTTVAGIAADVAAVADNVADVTNFADVYQGPKAGDPALRNDGSALHAGDLYFNTTENALRAYSGTLWVAGTAGTVSVTTFSGDGVETEFVLPTAPASENNTQVYIGGVYQQKDQYSVSGATITFGTAPVLGTDNIEVVTISTLALGETDAALVSYLPAGAGATARTVESKVQEVSVSITDYGGSPGATGAANSAALAAAHSALYQRGGGFLDIPPGEFTLANVGPGVLGGTGAASWDNRYCFRVTANNIVVRMYPGAKLKLGANENAHVVQFGGRDGTAVSVFGCGIIGGEIDGNRSNQVTPTATENHFDGINVSSGCSRIRIEVPYVHDCQYYGIGFQRNNFKDCSIKNAVIEDTGADGLDWKDDDGLNSGNIVDSITVRRHGLVAALAVQAGVNLRGGIKATNITVEEFDGDRHGIRFDSNTNAVNPRGSTLDGFTVVPGTVGTTNGVLINSGTYDNKVEVTNGRTIGASIGLDVRNFRSQVANVVSDACATGIQLNTEIQAVNLFATNCTTVGYKLRSGNNMLINCNARGNLLGLVVDSGATGNRLRGGVFASNTTNVTDNGTLTVISDVLGINTHSVGTASVPIDSTGEKTITIPHNLHFAPDLANVRLTLRRNTNVIDYVINPPYVYLADGTNVYAKVLVKTASATAGAVIDLMADCVAKKAERQ